MDMVLRTAIAFGIGMAAVIVAEWLFLMPVKAQVLQPATSGPVLAAAPAIQ